MLVIKHSLTLATSGRSRAEPAELLGVKRAELLTTTTTEPERYGRRTHRVTLARMARSWHPQILSHRRVGKISWSWLPAAHPAPSPEGFP